MKPKAITFDFYMTLIHPRNNKSRGSAYQDFLSAHHIQSDPWEHKILYDIFEFYADNYNPNAFETIKLSFWIQFTYRLFEKTNVLGYDENMARAYAETIRDIFGPTYFKPYPEVHEVLQFLQSKNIKLAIITNWQRGFKYFCQELNIYNYFNELVVSAEVGYQKPDVDIFKEAVKRFNLEPNEILHVGDSLIEDVQGAKSAGFDVVLLDRTNENVSKDITAITDLQEIKKMF